MLAGILISLFIEVRYDENYGFYTKGSQTEKLIFAESYLAENFPLTINLAKVGNDQGYHYVELRSNLLNNSGNFLNEIIISPQIELEYSTAKGNEYIQFDEFKLFDIKTGQKINFDKRIYYERKTRLFDPRSQYMDAVLKNKINKATLILDIEGTNNLGFRITKNIEMYPSLKEIDISNEWKKILNL